VDYFNEAAPAPINPSRRWAARTNRAALSQCGLYRRQHLFSAGLRLDFGVDQGTLLHFHNLGTDGLGHKDSLHAGMPVLTVKSGCFPSGYASGPLSRPPRVVASS